MIQYIDKDKAIAKIERFKKEEGWCQVGKDTADVYYARGFRFACERIINVLDTFEVKEVDLEKEIELVKGDYEQVDVAWNKDFDFIAKHFFELGMAVGNKAQKGKNKL